MKRALFLALLPALLAVPVPASAQEQCGLAARHPGQSSYRSTTFATAATTFYGDSLTYQSRRMVQARFPGVAVDAYWGRSTAPTVAAMTRDARRHLPRTVVMAIGTNDLGSPEEMARQVQAARAALPSSVRLIWVNTYVETRWDWQGANAAIESVPGVQIASWARTNIGARAGHPMQPSTLLSDGVHVTCEGARQRTELVAGALQHPQTSLRNPGTSDIR